MAAQLPRNEGRQIVKRVAHRISETYIRMILDSVLQDRIDLLTAFLSGIHTSLSPKAAYFIKTADWDPAWWTKVLKHRYIYIYTLVWVDLFQANRFDLVIRLNEQSPYGLPWLRRVPRPMVKPSFWKRFFWGSFEPIKPNWNSYNTNRLCINCDQPAALQTLLSYICVPPENVIYAENLESLRVLIQWPEYEEDLFSNYTWPHVIALKQERTQRRLVVLVVLVCDCFLQAHASRLPAPWSRFCRIYAALHMDLQLHLWKILGVKKVLDRDFQWALQ